MDWMIEAFNWCKANVELLKWIGLGIICLILSPILISLIKGLISGVVSIVKLIITIVKYPFMLIKKMDNAIKRRKAKKQSVYYNVG